MAPLPHNNTNILYLDYGVAGSNHTAQCRWSAPNTVADAMDAMDGFITALVPFGWRLITVTGARYQLQGTDVSVPVAWSGSPTYGTGAGNSDEGAHYIDFVGRSQSGRRLRVALFGCVADTFGDKYRIPVLANVPVSDAINALDGSEGSFLAIDGTPVNWHGYANIGQNAYWRNKIR